MEQQDLERIARLALRELGAPDGVVRVTAAEGQPDRWRVVLEGAMPMTFDVRAGRGTSAQHVRTQIFEQFQGR
jgi:hypothetical protein